MGDVVKLFGDRAASKPDAADAAALGAFTRGYSIEVMPRTADSIEDFRKILAPGTRVYVAHIAGTPIEEMRRTVGRLAAQGFEVMPHVPARLVADRATLDEWLAAYADLGAKSALALAGGVDRPAGDFTDSMQLLETGLFDKRGFGRIHVAGHPEGNRDIDPDGSERAAMEAARWKQAFSERTDAQMALVTQFVFEPEPVFDWAARLGAEGIELPIHVGVAGPAKLQTLIKFAIACGVGPSLRVLQRRAKDVTKLLRPFEPTELLAQLAAAAAAAQPGRAAPIAQVHLFPLGGIAKAAGYANALIEAGEAADAQRA